MSNPKGRPESVRVAHCCLSLVKELERDERHACAVGFVAEASGTSQKKQTDPIMVWCCYVDDTFQLLVRTPEQLDVLVCRFMSVETSTT